MRNDIDKWAKEFGADYEVPAMFREHPMLIDASWHNDMCPSFSAVGDSEDMRHLVLWSDHPVMEQREVNDKGSGRYLVCGCFGEDPINEETLLETDDALEALCCFIAAIPLYVTYQAEKAERKMIHKVANTFSAMLRKELGEVKFQSMLALNRVEQNPNVCHSHDYCDSNVTMAAAMAEHGFKNLGEEGMADDAVTIFNGAWTLAKNREFTVV